jgi:hypothetical protein
MEQHLLLTGRSPAGGLCFLVVLARHCLLLIKNRPTRLLSLGFNGVALMALERAIDAAGSEGHGREHAHVVRPRGWEKQTVALIAGLRRKCWARGKYARHCTHTCHASRQQAETAAEVCLSQITIASCDKRSSVNLTRGECAVDRRARKKGRTAWMTNWFFWVH